MAVKLGDTIKVEYEGKLDDGIIFDSSTHGDHSHPLEFEVGSHQIISGFENAVICMKEGEEKSVKIGFKEAYGEYKPELIKKITKDQLPPNVKKGMTLAFCLPNGLQILVKVMNVDETGAELDMNHPLAGKNLNFKIKVVSIN